MKDRIRCRKGATLAERIALHSVQAPSGCIIWTGARNAFGHGRIQIDGRTGYAHRVNWELNVGPVPAGQQLDHLCRRPACIRIEHLQAVDARTNVLRGTSPGARRVRTGACNRGHRSDLHGYTTPEGRMQCRMCVRALHAKYNANARARRIAERADRMADLAEVRNRSFR